MRYVKWTLITLLVLLVAATLHYNLPQRDIVRIVNTEVRRVDPGINAFFYSGAGSGDATPANRDVFFIEGIRPNGNPIVYRNEDTGWGWPPYLKFNSANLQAISRDLVSTSADPRWVAVRHYGWRNELFSIFPNATSIETVPGPDARLIPWTSITILILLAAFALWLRRLWVRFRRRKIEPLVDEIDADFDEAKDRVGGFFDRLFRRKK
ncbi:MAG: DUF1523 family protein [Paracoccaceae bacterium]|nr:DUF1523 family protein [Paracoccaceae bacterium]